MADDQAVAQALEAGRELGAAAVLFHARVAEKLGLGPSDTEVLDVLRGQGEITPKELCQLTGLAPASITGVIDRLERRGLAARRPHPTDGRRVLVAMAADAQERLMPMYAGLSRALAELFADLDGAELATVTRVLRAAASLQMEAADALPDVADRLVADA